MQVLMCLLFQPLVTFHILQPAQTGGSSSGAVGVCHLQSCPGEDQQVVCQCMKPMYGPDHRASTGGEIKPVSHTNPSALITFTEVMACHSVTMEASHAASVLSVCVVDI